MEVHSTDTEASLDPFLPPNPVEDSSNGEIDTPVLDGGPKIAGKV